MEGVMAEASSIDPAKSKTKPGMFEERYETRPPQSGQKSRVAVPPVSVFEE